MLYLKWFVGDTMQKRIDEMYQDYLYGRLDKIFVVSEKVEKPKKAYTIVSRGNFPKEYRFIDSKGNPISYLWFDKILKFKNGYAVIKKGTKWNFINEDCQIISDVWFDGVSEFELGSARVKKDGKWYLINGKGERISEYYLGPNIYGDIIFSYIMVNLKEKDIRLSIDI